MEITRSLRPTRWHCCAACWPVRRPVSSAARGRLTAHTPRVKKRVKDAGEPPLKSRPRPS